jgi:hypothetical protein
MGNDPSVGDPTRVYNTLVDSSAEMDRALCPDGMTNESRSGLYNNMIDITALPGRSKHSDSAVSTDIAMLAQLLGSEQGVTKHRENMGWRQENKDTLGKIRNRADLEEKIQELNAVREVVFRGQTNRLQAYLESFSYSADSVQWYLSSGLLPVMVMRSFDFFYRLICAVRDEAHQVARGTPWSKSLAAAMVSTHSQRLVRIRSYSTDWRDCIIHVYVYLREAERRGFHDESMLRLLWHRPAAPLAAAPALDRCSHCHCTRLHPGGRQQCILLTLKAVAARTALVDLDDDIALAVAEHIAAALARNPRANQDQVVADAQAACA